MSRSESTGKRKPRKSASGKKRSDAPGRLRIVAGNWRSRVLPVADVAGLRPTPERVRETLFNWLGSGIEGCRCLDLFAGTGALGFEALSRGAKEVVFVERSRRAVDTIAKNIRTLGADDAILVHGDAHRYLVNFGDVAFDVVFLDPPFADESIDELCRLLNEKGLVIAGGHVYFEQDRRQALPLLPPGWTLLREKTAGNVRYGLLRVADTPTD